MARILIVEDNALNIKLFCDLLAAHGHEPEAVTDSRNALDAARQFGPDLVITDIQLPHVSGLDLIRMIRKDEQLADVPIMAVTAIIGTRASFLSLRIIRMRSRPLTWGSWMSVITRSGESSRAASIALRLSVTALGSWP